MSGILTCFSKLLAAIRRTVRQSKYKESADDGEKNIVPSKSRKSRVSNRSEALKKQEIHAPSSTRVDGVARVPNLNSTQVANLPFVSDNRNPTVPHLETDVVPRIQIRKPTEKLSDDTTTPLLPSATSLAVRPTLPRDSDSFSGRDRSDSESSTDLSHALKDLLEEARIECPHRPFSYIIPERAQEDLITTEAVLNDIQLRGPNTAAAEARVNAEKTCDHAKHLFAILAYIKRGAEISRFLAEGITDGDLPFVRKADAKSKFALYRKNGEKIRVMETWKDKHLEKFDRVQWWMTAQVFDSQEHYELDSKTILPFIPLKPEEETLGRKHGGYSEVFPVRVHPAHHKFWPTPDMLDDEPLIAIKKLFSNDRTEFEKEESILKDLGHKKHPHLIKLLATYRQNGAYHLMFPWANANLRAYWEDSKNSCPSFDKETVLWSLRQMTGISNAINLVHNFRVTHPLAPGSGNVRMPKGKDNAKLSVSDKEKRFGRHGDLKPENILWFAQGRGVQDPRGVLQIADFGLGRFHGRDSRSKVNPNSAKGSPTYEPPEPRLHRDVSRAYDMWSLGCVYLEFITWLLKGPVKIDEFADRRGTMDTLDIDNDSFFEIIHAHDGDKAIVKDGVISWVNELHAHENCSALIHNLLDMIMDGLLVIDPQARFPASHLYQELNNCLERAERDDDYLLMPAPRHLRTRSTPSALTARTSHIRSSSSNHTAREKASRVSFRTEPKDLVLRNKGTPSLVLLSSQHKGTYKTWPPTLGSNILT